MKKWMAAAAFVLVMAGCNEGLRSDENNSDSTSVLVDNPSPAGNTTNQVNSNTGSYQSDTSNRNGDDSVKGTNPASRKTTPRSPGSGNKQ